MKKLLNIATVAVILGLVLTIYVFTYNCSIYNDVIGLKENSELNFLEQFLSFDFRWVHTKIIYSSLILCFIQFYILFAIQKAKTYL